MKWISTIKKIGKKAVDNKDGMVILFSEGHLCVDSRTCNSNYSIGNCQ